jgi:dienelactone hydrolase
MTRERLVELLGRLPALVEADLEVLDVEQRDGYRVERIVFDSEAAMSVPALLFVPDGAEDDAPRPAVLAVHGHGTTKDTIGTPGGLVGSEGAAGADYAHRLAAAGLVVLAPDLRGFGERSDWTPEDHYHCDADLVNGLLVGTTPLAQNLWDMARCIDVLQGLAYVDRTRIGACGWSYGGTIALFLTAWDERVSAALVSCALASIASSHRVPWNFCGSQVLPGMADELDHPSLVGLIAPRPLIAENAEDDLIFPLDAARATLETAHAAYVAAGAPDGTELFVIDGDHRFDGTDALPALVQALSSAS